MAGTRSRPLVLFRVAAGPRMGFGHLTRALTLARALRVVPWISVRGGPAARAAVSRLGGSLAGGDRPGEVLDGVGAALLVVDDRVASRTAPWRRAARRRGVPITSIHDLGLGLADADLVIDGSVCPGPSAACRCETRLGPDYAILRPEFERGRTRPRPRAGRPSVLIALGGNPRRTAALALARRLARLPGAPVVRIAQGFVGGPRPMLPQGIRPVPPARFDDVLRRATVALVGGGLTLYEAACLGVPCVAVDVHPSQRPTVSAFARRGAVLDGGSLARRPSAGSLRATEACVERLLADERLRVEIGRAARGIVDGHGADRVARVLREQFPAAMGKRAV